MKNKHSLPLPWVIMHNTITVDGSTSGFEADLDTHYRIAASLKAQGYLVGSQTVLDAFTEVPEKQDRNYIPEVDPSDTRPYWIVVDSKGRLRHILDFFRKLEYIKEIIVLTAQNTPKNYISFLKKRKYPYIRVGDEYVNYREVFKLLREEYGINRLLTDTGNKLNNILLEQGLVSAISLLIAPHLLAFEQSRIFSGLNREDLQINLELYDCQKTGNKYVWLHYHLE